MFDSGQISSISGKFSRAMQIDLRLMPPAEFAWTKYHERYWMLAALPREELGKLTDAYFNSATLRHLSDVTGHPVTANRAAMVYVVLLSDRPKLPKMIDFPETLPGQDVISLGVSLRGNVNISAATMENVMIGATQNAGKSNMLKVLVHQARFYGWKLYLTDPQGHTFEPDTWRDYAEMDVARSGEDVRGLIAVIDGELKVREALFRKDAKEHGGIPAVDIDAYNGRCDDSLARVMLAMDEANDFLGDKGIEADLTRLAREGRKYGLHIVVAAHNWRDSRGRGVSREFSGRMTTRISLAVSDDTSGDVVLESNRWGRWVSRRLPKGRGVIRLRGQYVPFQTFYIKPEQEAGWFENGSFSSVPGPLSKMEIEMVKVAVGEYGGAFRLREMASRFGQSMYQVSKLAKAWEMRGWLSEPADAVSPRFVTAKLRELAGIFQTGEQVKQAQTGAKQVKQDIKQVKQGDFENGG